MTLGSREFSVSQSLAEQQGKVPDVCYQGIRKANKCDKRTGPQRGGRRDARRVTSALSPKDAAAMFSPSIGEENHE